MFKSWNFIYEKIINVYFLYKFSNLEKFRFAFVNLNHLKIFYKIFAQPQILSWVWTLGWVLNPDPILEYIL